MTVQPSHTALDILRDFDAIRALFPVTQYQAYLMNAAQSPLNTRSRAALDFYLDMVAHYSRCA
jgi:hypothetical protein